MSYSDGHAEMQTVGVDSWEPHPLDAHNPGLFDWTASPGTCITPMSQGFDEYQRNHPNNHPFRLGFVPLGSWDERRLYDEQPPIYLHYLIEWKVNLTNRVIVRVTEPDLVLAPSVYWERTLRKKAENVKCRRAFQNRRVRVDDSCIVASLNDRTQHDLHQQFEGTDIDWTATEKQILVWGDRFLKGKQIKLDICINYSADDVDLARSRKGDKRSGASVTNKMLADRDNRIDAKQICGERSPWRDVYKKMRCPGSPCENRDGYCWQDPSGKKHYFLKTHYLKRLVDLVKKGNLDLETHGDVPDEIQQQLRAEEQQRLERQKKSSKNTGTESVCPPINIHFVPQSAPSSVMTTPSGSSPLLSPSRPDDPKKLIIPDLPLDRAVKEYSSWQQSRVECSILKDNITKACDVALSNGLDLRQIYKDRDSGFFTTHGVIVGVARRFVDDIWEWSDDYMSAT